MKNDSVPTTTVDLMVQFQAGLRSAGYSQDEISARIAELLQGQVDAMQADPAKWATAAFTDSSKCRSLYYAAVGVVEGGLSFDDATAYFARDAKALNDGRAKRAISASLNEMMIVRAMEDQGIVT